MSKPAKQPAQAQPAAVAHPFKAARRAGVPIIAIETADPAKAIVNCLASRNGREAGTPIIYWDLIRGFQARSESAGKVLQAVCGDQEPQMFTNPAEALGALAAKPKNLTVKTDDGREQSAIIFFFGASRLLDNPAVIQGVWNCRDTFESAPGAMLALLGPSFKIPDDLKNDIVTISEALPAAAELSAILDSIADDAGMTPTAIEGRDGIIDTMTGVSAFGARQALAMSITKDGIDREGLWDRKRKLIEQTPGLAVWKGGSTFADLGGLSNLKEFLTRVLTSGKTPVRAIGFIDEIEKGLAGTAGDTSGTSQDQLQVFLKVMQDLNIPGIILLGHAGTGKSEIAKGAGNVAGCPVIAIDTGAMKGSLVGESEGRIRAAMDVFKAVSQGKGLLFATCNKIASLPPELRRRFTLGTFFVDLPDATERALIWPLWIARFGLDATQAIPACEGWTGAEIRACCDVAYRTGLPLLDAAAYVVPVVKSAPEQVESLRKLANNRFINASAPGVYQYKTTTQDEAPARRKMEL